MDNSPNVDLAPIWAIFGVWSLVGLAYYVWYLWSLSRLFPKLGLPSWAGWVPLWNQWQLIQRGGLPGWTVVLGLVPGLGIVVLVMTIIAINRLNAEHGKGPGFTVLGAFIPPLWAMLLAAHIDDYGYSGRDYGSVEQGGSPQYQRGGAYQPGAREYQQSTGDGWAAVAPPGPAAPGVPGAPAQPQQYAPPMPAQHAVPPPAPQAAPAAGSPPSVPGQPQPVNAWGFSSTTEGAFERLASDEQAPRSAPPLGSRTPPQPFSWPEPQEELEARRAREQAAAPGQVPPGQAPPGQVPPGQVPPGLPQPPQPQPQPVRLPEPPAGPTIFDRPGYPVPEAPAVPRGFPAAAGPEHAQAPPPPVVPAPAPAPAPAPVTPATPAPAAAAPDDEDSDDRTVVVSRRVRWGVELPDGEVLELEGDDIVIGRKPEPAGGATVLQIADPTRTMSKTHARLRRDGDDWTVEDLQSTNGVALIDERGETVALEPGREYEVIDQLVIGTLEVRLRRIG